MNDFATVWANAQATEFKNEVPPVGLYEVRVDSTRAGKSKAGESYVALTLKSGEHEWGIYKEYTKGGVPHEGRITSLKILMQQLGLPQDIASEQQLIQAFSSVEGQSYMAEVKSGSAVNPTTGEFYKNTDILSKVQPPVGSDLTPPAAAPAAPGAQFGNDIPWES